MCECVFQSLYSGDCSCEVRPGPEFITRSYRFYADLSFQALQFFYQDPDCSEPSYSLRIRGSVRPLRGSWLVRGGAVCEYHLSRVQLLCHGPAAELVQQRLRSSCDLRQPLRPGRTYELWDERWAAGRDCTRGLDFSMQELRLMRLERRGHHGDPSRPEELFLGDVHTERAQRSLHQPAGYQTPLQSAKVSAAACACAPAESGALILSESTLSPGDRKKRLKQNRVCSISAHLHTDLKSTSDVLFPNACE